MSSFDDLEREHADALADLTVLLDIAGGVDDVLRQLDQAQALDAVRDVLDLKSGTAAALDAAGLAAIRPDHPSLFDGVEPKLPPSGNVEQLFLLPAPTRLSLRTTPGFRRLREVVEVLGDLTDAIARPGFHRHALDLAHDVIRRAHTDPAEEPYPIPNVAFLVDLARELANPHRRALDIVLALDLAERHPHAHTHELARARTAAIKLARDVDSLSKIDRVRLDQLARVRHLASTLELALRFGNDEYSTDTGDNARALVMEIEAILHPALYKVLSVTEQIAAVYATAINLNLTIENVDSAEWNARAQTLTSVANNFIEADLRTAKLDRVADLTGVYWSTSTRWPPEWEDYVRATSSEIEPGIFEVIGVDPGRHGSVTYAGR